MADKTLRDIISQARKLMDEGAYRKAFDLIIDQPAEDARDLFNKVSCLTDIGFVLRDEKVLRYGIYLLENHGEEIALVPEYTPFVYINLANQYANMGALYSFNDDYWAYYRESELDRAKNCYLRALDAEDLPPALKGEIYGNLASVYLNLGRRWEALECYENALTQHGSDRNYLEKKCSLLVETAHFNGENRQVLFREVYARAREVLEDREDFTLSERFGALREYLDGKLTEEERKEEEIYPSGTLETEDSFQHYYVSFCVKNRLYVNICSFCCRCDFAVGDRAVFDSRRFQLQRGEGNYYKLVSGFNRLKERYMAGRYLLGVAGFEEGSLAFADMLAPRAKLRDYKERSINETLCETAFMTGWEIIESIGPLLSLFLDGKSRFTGTLRELFEEEGEAMEMVRREKHPSLHAIHNIYYDLTKGIYRYLFHMNGTLRRPFTDELSLESYPKKGQLESTILLYRNLRNIIIYLMSLFDSRETEWHGEADFQLFPFHLPDSLVY
ncbi:MAG: tetratricopeptide repeat protein [Spirochaetales bacterium]|nr:tetratricopeptide repeat protein [Spirochaetales bacterium]